MLQPFLDLFFASGTIMSIEKGRLLIGFGKRHWMKEIDDASKPAFYFPDFFLQTETPWFQQEFCFEVSIESFLQELTHKNAHRSALQWQPGDRDLFRRGFDELQKQFSEGRLSKGVPYIFETSKETLSPSRRHHCLESLLRFATVWPVYCYGFWDENEGILGASPELLFHIEKGENSKLKTMALAGTLGHHENLEAFKKDPKECDEHGKVVNGIKESLSHFGKVLVGELQDRSVGSLVHLLTPIEADLKGRPDLELLIQALHPTPALGAFPRKEGMKWLKRYQRKSQRGRYGAPVGAVRGGDEEAFFYVAIRGLQWDKEGTAIGAGCGVVPQSSFEQEWSEVNRKITSIKEVFSIV